MFNLTDEDFVKFAEWKATLPCPTGLNEDGFPVGGAIGGRWTYSFTPTSIGCVVKIKDGISGQELDLSDYNHW